MDDNVSPINKGGSDQTERKMTPEFYSQLAANLNATLQRCAQLGRTYFDAQDAKTALLKTQLDMQLKPVEGGVRIGAPQTQVSAPVAAAVVAVEKAITGDAA